jgi:hypothetical protein
MYWAQQAQQCVYSIEKRLCLRFGQRTIDMSVRVPIHFNFTNKLADLVLTHGIEHITFPEGQAIVHQDLGDRWDGVIRTGLGNQPFF